MKRQILRTLAIAAIGLAVFGGCKHHHEEGSEMTVPTTELPAVVRDGVAKQYPGATITKTEKETYPDGTIHWEVEVKTTDGKTAEAEFDSTGKLLPEH